MTGDRPSNELVEILKGMGLLLLYHILAGFIIFIMGFIIGMFFGGYIFLGIWALGGASFFFVQLAYVIPLVLRLRRQGKIGMMKGVIIGATITALLNGTCSLMLYRGA